jgi:hypothetical protein
MRYTILVILLGGSVGAQSMIEHAAAAAGGSAGGVAGKKVSDGMTKIFNKVDKQAAKAAESGTNTPLFEVGPGVPKATAAESVPPPPPPHHAAVHKAMPAPLAAPPEPAAAVIAPLPPPPPPEATLDDLHRLTAGMNREDVLKFGPPASRITMFDDGHLVEIYRYMAKDETFGVVRLSDGAVYSVQVK